MKTAKRSRAGNAMLELVLVLPVYMLLLFVLISLAEYGQVATQLHLAARYAAWRDDDPNTAAGIFLNHFRPRVTTGGAAGMCPKIDFDGSENGLSLPAVGAATVPGAASYGNGVLPDALWGGQGTLIGSQATQTNGLALPASAQADLGALAHLALDGDTQQPGGTTGVPWLLRRYVSIAATYAPMGKLVPPQEFRVFATVLRPRSYGSAQPAAYPTSLGGGTIPCTLRAAPATAIPPATAPVTGTRPGGHQMKALRTPQLLDHTATPPIP
jgi:hypothetical protein